jgi:hypothetical protein
MKRFVLLALCLVAPCLAEAAVSESRADAEQVMRILKAYGTHSCEADDCYHVGMVVSGSADFTAENGEVLHISATYQIELWEPKDGSSPELLAQFRGLDPGRKDEVVPDVVYMTDRNADGSLDATVLAPFFSGKDLAGQFTVSTFQHGCWDQRGQAFCGKKIPEGELVGIRNIYAECLRAIITYYRRAVELDAKANK